MNPPGMLIRPNVIRSIVLDVFRLMLKIQIEPVLSGTDYTIKGTKVTGVVSMSSPAEDPEQPNYAVVLEMTQALAFKVVGAMLEQEVDTWSDLAEDACGEITNMIAGNAKKHLITSHVLSMPTVIYGVDYQWCLPHLEVKQIEIFQCGTEYFKVLIGEEKRRRPL